MLNRDPSPVAVIFEVGAGTALADPSRDVHAFRFPVFRGTDRIAVYNAAISDSELVSAGLEASSVESLMWALARVSVPHLTPLLVAQRIPRRDNSLYEIRVQATDVVGVIGEGPPTGSRLRVPDPRSLELTEFRVLRRLRFAGLFGFREQQSVPLSGLTVVIGENGAGKTSIASVLAAFAAIADDRPPFMGPEWAYRSTYDRAHPAPWMEVEIGDVDKPLRYRVALEPDRRGAATLTEESLTVDGMDLLRVPGDGFAVQYRQRVWLDSGSFSFAVVAGPSNGKAGRYDGNAVLPTLRMATFFPEAEATSSLLGGVRNYAAWSMADRAEINEGVPVGTDGSHLRENGSNLAAVLRTRRQQGSLDLFDERFAEVMRGEPRLRGVEDGELIRLVYDHNGSMLSSAALSDGSLRWAQIICAVQTAASLVVLDEPELGLHPDLIGPLADLLMESASRTPLVILTHSPALLDRLTESNVRITLLVAEQEPDGNLISAPDLDSLREAWPADEHPVSELWARGLLGGNRW